MKSPNIFLHYWANQDSMMTFQDILGQDIPTEILDNIQIDIQRQLNSQKLPEIFPCFDWESDRFIERWEALSKTLVLQVQLPQEIWENWINELLDEENITQNKQVFNPFEDPNFAHFEQNEAINPLLSAEVYFQKPEELEEMEERIEERREKREERNEERREKVENRNEERREENEERREKREERNEERREESEERREKIEDRNEERREEIEMIFEEEKEEEEFNHEDQLTLFIEEEIDLMSKEVEYEEDAISIIEKIIENGEENNVPEPKNILEQLQTNSAEEKFFETISVSNSSLKNLVESKMTEQLSETISINQKIQFILQLFDGDSNQFNELIEFIDQEANASNWQNELNQRYIPYQNQGNLEAWKDFYLLVQRKFN